MVYLLSNICIKNYWNRTTIIEILLSMVVMGGMLFRDTV